MGENNKVIIFRSKNRGPSDDDGFDDLVATMREATVPQIVLLLAAAHEADVLAAIATQLREVVDGLRSLGKR